MSRKKSLKIAQIVSIVALIIVLIALFYFEKKIARNKRHIGDR